MLRGAGGVECGSGGVELLGCWGAGGACLAVMVQGVGVLGKPSKFKMPSPRKDTHTHTPIYIYIYIHTHYPTRSYPEKMLGWSE